MEEEIIKSEYNAYNKGFEAGKNHSAPSPETRLFMETIENKILDLEKYFCEFKDEIKEKLNGIPSDDKMRLFVKEAIDGALSACDKRYAEKRVETIINWLAVVVGTAVIGGAITLLYKFIEYMATN